MFRGLGRLPPLGGALWLLAALSAAPALAQQVKGPTTCFKCHKPLPRSVWEQTAAFHKDSIKQLSAPKAAGFAAAIGLPSPMTVTGRPGDCVSCHATVVGGAVSTGVSCESCHGAASGYFNPHQEPEFYDQPVSKWLGLHNLYNDPKAIAQVCVDCHVTPDPRLKKAGHPAGETFDPGKGIVKMVHWPTDISTKRKRAGYGPALYAQISSQAGPLASRRLASAGSAAAPAARPAVPGGAAPAPAGARAPAPRGARPAAAADPFDWDQPVSELPADYPSDSGAPATGASAVAPAAPGMPQAPSTAAELPPAPMAPPLVSPMEPTAAAQPGTPVPPKAPLPALRGRAVSIVDELLKAKGAGQVVLPAPAPPREYAGPDGELLRLQDEVLYLALEALRKKP
jgi:Cytochrome c554 and c-prime